MVIKPDLPSAWALSGALSGSKFDVASPRVMFGHAHCKPQKPVLAGSHSKFKNYTDLLWRPVLLAGGAMTAHALLEVPMAAVFGGWIAVDFLIHVLMYMKGGNDQVRKFFGELSEDTNRHRKTLEKSGWRFVEVSADSSLIRMEKPGEHETLKVRLEAIPHGSKVS